jgi:hypothetical protein
MARCRSWPFLEYGDNGASPGIADTDEAGRTVGRRRGRPINHLALHFPSNVLGGGAGGVRRDHLSPAVKQFVIRVVRDSVKDADDRETDRRVPEQ